MEYIKIRFANGLEQLDYDFEKAVDDIFRTVSPAFSLSESSWQPLVDIYETPGEIIIRVELAGVAPKDLHVEVNRRAVRLRGVRKGLSSRPDSSYRLAEIQYGRFERILYLPVPIDPEVVSGAYNDGVLQLRLARVEENRVYQIPIREK